MKVHEGELASDTHPEGSFALPILPEEIVDNYALMRLHIKAEGGPVLWRRDGAEIADQAQAYRIEAGQTRTIEEPESFERLRFKFEGAGKLQFVYEGRYLHGWLKDPPPMTQEEFAAPIAAAVSAPSQMRTRNCVDVVRSTNPGAVMASTQSVAAEAEPELDSGQQQALARAKALMAAVQQREPGQ